MSQYTKFAFLQHVWLLFFLIDIINVSNIIFVLKKKKKRQINSVTCYDLHFLSNAVHDLIFDFQRLAGMLKSMDLYPTLKKVSLL